MKPHGANHPLADTETAGGLDGRVAASERHCPEAAQSSAITKQLQSSGV